MMLQLHPVGAVPLLEPLAALVVLVVLAWVVVVVVPATWCSFTEVQLEGCSLTNEVTGGGSGTLETPWRHPGRSQWDLKGLPMEAARPLQLKGRPELKLHWPLLRFRAPAVPTNRDPTEVGKVSKYLPA